MGLGIITAGALITYDVTKKRHGDLTPGYVTGAMFLTSGTIVLPLGLIRLKAGKKCRQS